ncbi:MAG: hypothetical protein HON70_37680, partial [Lentisphaerae bacterium]|nr:hypothetical protein [Lentisphaerota bacterium]
KPKGPYTSGICDLVLVPGTRNSTIFATIQGRYTDPEKKLWQGGVYASYDCGKTWVEKNKGLERSLPRLAKGPHSYSLIAGCRAQPSVMYWAAWNGVYKTEDSGETWALTTHLGTEWKKGPDFDGKEIHWRLRRHESNFDQSYYNAYGPANGLACSASDPDAVAYTDNAGIAVSHDGGAHWTEPGFEFGEAVWPNAFGDRPPMRLTHKVRSRGIQLIVPLDLAVDPFAPKTIAIGHCDIGLMISRDGGEWWEWGYREILTGERNYIRAITYDPQVKGRMWVAGGGWNGTGHVYRSDDGGHNFQVAGIPHLNAEVERSGRKLYVHDLVLVPHPNADTPTLYAATDFGIFTTDDAGASWKNGTIGLEAFPHVKHVVSDPAEPERLYATAATTAGTAHDAGLFRSDDSGCNWVRLGTGTIGLVRSLSLGKTTGVIYVIALAPGQAGYWSPRSLYHSLDHGETWARLDDRFGACVAAHPAVPGKVFYMTFAQDIRRDTVNVRRSTDNGQSWQPVAGDIPLSPGGTGNQLIFDPNDPARFFLLHNSGTYEGRESTPGTPGG